MKTQHLSIIIGISFVSFIFLMTFGNVYAYTCAVKPPSVSLQYYYLQSDSVFVGTISSITNNTNHQLNVKFDVVKSWKGSQHPTITTYSLVACGYSLVKGEKYLVFATGYPLDYNPWATKQFDNAQDIISLLDSTWFQAQAHANEELYKKLVNARDAISNMMASKITRMPISSVGVNDLDFTLDVGIADKKAALSSGAEEYKQKLEEIVGDVPIRVQYEEYVTALPEVITQHPTLSPLKQFKSGIAVADITCWEGLQLVIKSENGTPACVKPDTAKKLVERGWTTPAEFTSGNESHKVSSSINQTIAIGNNTYDTTEFQTITGNTVYLDDVKFTYQGSSPVNNSCYPDFTNQTEARDFEMIPGNISDMNAHQCWPPSNYPQKITKEGVLPPDLFSRYSISFFDYNQTIGVGFCHSDSCDLGKTLYLVKRGWDTPVTYDDPVSLLEFHLGTNASVISSGQAIDIEMSTSNKLSRSILVPYEYNYSFEGTGLGPCTYGPFNLAILEGYFGENNFTHGSKLSLYQPGIYSCPVWVAPHGYKFEPMSDNAVGRCDPFSGCSTIGQIQFRISFSGFWNNTSFHKFQSGLYTIIAGDEWGHLAIQHFTVVNKTQDVIHTTMVPGQNHSSAFTIYSGGGSISLSPTCPMCTPEYFNETTTYTGNVGKIIAGYPVLVKISDPYTMSPRADQIPAHNILPNGTFHYTINVTGKFGRNQYTLNFIYGNQIVTETLPVLPP